MEIRYISFAGCTVAIKFYTPRFPRLCSYFKNDFLEVYKDFDLSSNPKKIDFTINIKDQSTLQIIKLPKNDFNTVHFYKDQTDTALTTYYHIGIYQFQVIIRMVVNILLAKKKNFIFHASASLKDGKVSVFLAKSGGGKSTIVKLLDPLYKAYADDTLIISRVGSHYLAYQTPFIEKDTLIQKQSNGFPIKGIYFLKKKPNCVLKKITKPQTITKNLFQNIWFDLGYSRNNIANTAVFLDHFQNFYTLGFNKNEKEVSDILTTRK